MFDERELERSSDKLAYICQCMAEDSARVINKLRAPYFHQFICKQIELWCDNRGENVDYCIQKIHGIAMKHRFMNNGNGNRRSC